jgi:hypothetical protein
MTDPYTPYETGLRALLGQLGRDHARYDDALVYQQRLTENLQTTRRYGDTETRRAERAEIVDRLNALAREALGVSYSALCQSEEAVEAAPPPHIDTGGGAYIVGNVTVQGGDFVGRDQKKSDAQRPVPPIRPPIPTEGEPLALIAAALQARRLLLVWATVPFPPETRPTGTPALLIKRWRRDAQSLRPFPWPVPQLPPLTILSLDPSDRIEAAFREAGAPLSVLCTQKDVINPHQHNLIKLAGSLALPSTLLLTWADVRGAPNDPDRVHLLREARRVAKDSVVLMFTDTPGERFVQLWHELVRSYISSTRHHVALGPADARWPDGVRHLSTDVKGTLTQLTKVEVPIPALGPLSLETPLHRTEIKAIHNKLDRLLEGQDGLRAGQGAIYRRLTSAQRETVTQVLAALQAARLDDAGVKRELRDTLDAVRRALLHLQAQQLPDMTAELQQTLEEVTEIVRADVDLRTGLELTIPLIPLLLTYKTTLETGPGLDLRQAWEDLINQILPLTNAPPTP